MATYRVTEGFATPMHRFTAGMEIDSSDIDGPIPVDRWVELGKLAPAKLSSRKRPASEGAAGAAASGAGGVDDASTGAVDDASAGAGKTDPA